MQTAALAAVCSIDNIYYRPTAALCVNPFAMKNNMGIESMVLVRDAKKATRRAFAFASSVAATKPRIFF